MRILLILFLSMATVACKFVLESDTSQADTDISDDSESAPTVNTLTVGSELMGSELIKVADGFDVKRLSTGDCVRIRRLKKLVISLEKGQVVRVFCSNIDDKETNNCEGSYNALSSVDSSTGEKSLNLVKVSALGAEASCQEMFPVYTITVKASLPEGQTIKIQNGVVVKTLTTKDQCVRMQALDFNDLQVTIGKAEEGSRKFLCGGESFPCGRKNNYEVAASGPPAISYTLKTVQSMNESSNCEWLTPPSL